MLTSLSFKKIYLRMLLNWNSNGHECEHEEAPFLSPFSPQNFYPTFSAKIRI